MSFNPASSPKSRQAVAKASPQRELPDRTVTPTRPRSAGNPVKGSKNPQQLPGIHGALDADGEGRIARLFADQQDVSAQVDDPAFDAPAKEQRLDLIRNIPLGEGAQVQEHAGPSQVRRAGGLVQDEVVHAQQAQGGGELAVRGIVPPVPDIPQVDEGAHGHIEIPARFLIHLLGEAEQLHGIGGNGHGLHPRGGLHPTEIAEGGIGVQQVAQTPYLLKGRVKVLLCGPVQGQRDHCVQQVVRAGKGLGLGLTARNSKEQQRRQQKRDCFAHGRPPSHFVFAYSIHPLYPLHNGGPGCILMA